MVFRMLNPLQPTLLYDGNLDQMLIVWGKKKSGELIYEPMSRRCITEAEILEDGMKVTSTIGASRSTTQRVRASVRGQSGLGFGLGSSTSNRRRSQSTVSQNVITRVVLQLITLNGNVPIIEYSLLARPAASHSNEYLQARHVADIWHIRIQQQLLKEDARLTRGP